MMVAISARHHSTRVVERIATLSPRERDRDIRPFAISRTAVPTSRYVIGSHFPSRGTRYRTESPPCSIRFRNIRFIVFSFISPPQCPASVIHRSPGFLGGSLLPIGKTEEHRRT